MAPGWEMGMGSSAAGSGPMHDTSAQSTYLYQQRTDDLLDFSNNDDFLFPSSSSAALDSHLLPPPPKPSAPFSMNEISSSSNHHHFSFSNNDQLYIPYCEEEAELEWLSRFVDDSFSDIPYHHVPPVSSPAPPSQSSPSTTSSSSSSSDLAMAEHKAGNAEKSSSSSNSNGRGLGGGKKGAAGEVGVRRCTHCASEKTPQWRTGPMGPKTLCNACGVRYKSGRLVPEYRPAASPTFILTQHSNSHRKVLELRRQKELMLASAAAAAGALPEFLLP